MKSNIKITYFLFYLNFVILISISLIYWLGLFLAIGNVFACVFNLFALIILRKSIIEHCKFKRTVLESKIKLLS